MAPERTARKPTPSASCDGRDAARKSSRSRLMKDPLEMPAPCPVDLAVDLAVGQICGIVATAHAVARMQRCIPTTGLRGWQINSIPVWDNAGRKYAAPNRRD